MNGRRMVPLSLSPFLGLAALAAIVMLVAPASGQGVAGWAQEAKLLADDGFQSDAFGFSVAIDGDTAVVGAPHDYDGGHTGSGYVFFRSESTWVQQAKLTPEDGASQDEFGIAVAVDGDTAIVGAWLDDDNGTDSGSAYVFVRSGGTWTQEAKLLADDGTPYDAFGYSVAVSGDTAAVGAFQDDPLGNESGSVYVFARSGGVWTQQAKIYPADGSAIDHFGTSVAIDGDTLLAGAPGDEHNGTTSGSAYILVRNGSTWTQQAKLLPGDGADGDRFGWSVALEGSTAVAGARYDDDNGSDSGSAYVFAWDGTTWSQQAKLLAGDGAADDQFGVSVAVSGERVAVGSEINSASGSAYLFVRESGSWSQEAQVLPADGAPTDRFGYSTGLSADTFLAGAYADDDNGVDSGSAYVFRLAIAAPDAVDDYACTLVDRPVLVDVAANDSDPDGNLDPSTAVVISGPDHGSVENHGDGTMTYSPDPGWSGLDGFDYEISDTEGQSDTATVHLSVDTAGATRYVAPTGSDSSFCSDPENPCLTVQYALDTGHDGDYVKVAEGTYADLHVRPRADITSTGVVTQVLYVDTSVTVEGGYAPPDWGAPDPLAHPTIIDAGGGGRGIYVTGDIQPTLAGLRIQHGDATGMGGWPDPWIGGEEDAGGGMYVISATATIRDNLILSNTAQEQALFLIYSDASVEGNLVSGNQGGGAQLYWCGATVTRNTISDNDGTGLVVMFDNCPRDGDCHASTIGSNTLEANTDRGLYLFINSATIDGNHIAANSCYEGAGLYANLVWGQISNNVFAGNHADASAGAVYVIGDGDQVPKLMNNTFAANTAGDGSGIYMSSWGDDPGVFYFSNTIVASHTVGIHADMGATVILEGVLWHNTPVTATHSATSTVIVEHQLTGEPEFVWPAGGDYHLGPTSAARDTGAWAYWHPDHDIDGQPRRMGWAPDLGADEVADARLTLDSQASAWLVAPGSTVTYTLVITSDGVLDATAVVVTDGLDDWQRATAAWSSLGGCTIPDPGWGGEVQCTLGTMAPGTEAVVTVEALVRPVTPPAQPMTNTAEVMADESGWADWDYTVTPGDLTYPLEQDPWTLDISLINDDATTLVQAQLMEGLYRTGPASELEPAGALGYEVSGDFQTYTVTLRADAVWSDGQPVVAQHYADGMIRLLDPQTGADRAWMLFILENAEAFNYGWITDPDLVGVQALNDTTLRFTLREPAAHFPSILAGHATYPVRLDLIGSDPDWTEPGHFVGTGAYLLAAREPGHWLILDKNPLYHGAAGVHFGPLLLPILPAGEQLAAYEAGLVDVSLVPPEEVDRIMADPLLEPEYQSRQARGVYYLGLNTQIEATEVVTVRMALASAIDRETIVRDVRNEPRTEAATSVIAPNIPGYQNGLVGYAYDPAQAQVWLAEAGYPGGAGFPSLELWSNGAEIHSDTVEAVAAGWRDVLSITVNTAYYDWDTYVALLDACRDDPAACPYGAYRLGWLMDYADAYNLLNDLFHPDSEKQYTGWNSFPYRQLIERSRTESNPNMRTAYFRTADRILVEGETAVIPLFFYDRTLLVKADVACEYPSVGEPFLMNWSEAAAMYVRLINLRYAEPQPGRYAVLGMVRILDENYAPVEGATVEGEWTLPNGKTRLAEGITNSLGVARLRVGSTQAGIYELCVTDVQAAGYVYDPDQNWETCDTITVP